MAADLEALLEARPAGVEAAICWIDRDGPTTRWSISDEEPRFLIYSVTKVAIAVLVLQLVEEGSLALDQKLEDFRPDVPNSSEISIRRLLQHRSGLPDYGDLELYHRLVASRPGEPWSFEEFARHTWESRAVAPPGRRFLYANPGFMLLGRVVESLRGVSLAQCVEQRIAEPLALASTSVVELPAQLRGLIRAPSRLLGGDAERDARACYHPGWVSHGVMASTASETAALLASIARGQIVCERLVQEMTDLLPVGTGTGGGGSSGVPWVTPSYGLGVMGDPDSPFGRIWGHNGGGPGYSASTFHVPEHPRGPVTVCALATGDPPHAEGLLWRALSSL